MAELIAKLEETTFLSLLLAAEGLSIVALGMRRSGVDLGPVHAKGLLPGEEILALGIQNIERKGPIPVRIGDAFPAVLPSILYKGPGRDTYTYFRIVQNVGGDWVTVYGSGVAGLHLFASATPQIFALVSTTEIQPAGCPSQSLCAFPWPGEPKVTGICGGPAQPGVATAVLEIYGKMGVEDADGFSSPTCVGRMPIDASARVVFKDAIVFRGAAAGDARAKYSKIDETEDLLLDISESTGFPTSQIAKLAINHRQQTGMSTLEILRSWSMHPGLLVGYPV